MKVSGCGMLIWAGIAVGGSVLVPHGAARAQTSSGPAAFADRMRQIEQRRVQALVRGDRSVLDRFIAADYHLVSPLGTIDDKADEIKGALSGIYVSLIPGPIAVRRAGADAAILRYEVAAKLKLRRGPFEAHYWHTDYYERHHGQWQVVWSQSTEIRSPSAPPAASVHGPSGEGGSAKPN
jgi:hypothetical protein